jgi:hypothetical protein
MSQTYIPAVLRRFVCDRAGECCEYCLIPESVGFAPHWIDHIVAEKHGGKTEAENLAYCCALCNQRKGSDLSSIDPETGDVFRVSAGRIEPLTSTGRVTVHLLQLNVAARVQEREQLMAAGLLRLPTG